MGLFITALGAAALMALYGWVVASNHRTRP